MKCEICNNRGTLMRKSEKVDKRLGIKRDVLVTCPHKLVEDLLRRFRTASKYLPFLEEEVFTRESYEKLRSVVKDKKPLKGILHRWPPSRQKELFANLIGVDFNLENEVSLVQTISNRDTKERIIPNYSSRDVVVLIENAVGLMEWQEIALINIINGWVCTGTTVHILLETEDEGMYGEI